MTVQYWTSATTGETWAVQLDREGGEIKGVCGPLSCRDVPRDARDGDFDFDAEFYTRDHFQTHWDEFRKGFVHERADLMGGA